MAPSRLECEGGEGEDEGGGVRGGEERGKDGEVRKIGKALSGEVDCR